VEIHGVRLAGELKVRLTFDDPDALELYDFCGERRLPITIHLDYPIPDAGGRYPRPTWWYGGSLDALERALGRCPRTAFIGHAPGFWAHISNDDRYAREAYPSGPVVPGGRLPDLMRQYPNLWADLSAGSALNAITRDHEFGRRFLLEFQDRLLFGRDYFDTRLYDYLKELALPEAAWSKITHANAQRLLTSYLG
jgi:predicted TIM-barrel fold metal-dependent hydrolase